MILAGDMGGTKTLLALMRTENPREPLFERRYSSGSYPGLAEMLGDFLAAARNDAILTRIDAACLGVAGPVADNRAKITNLPWQVDGRELESTLGTQHVLLVNDFHAAAAGIEMLTADEVETLQSGDPLESAPRLVIGAGTGLGVALLVRHGATWQVLPGEGGHCGFSPTDVEQDELWRDLHGQLGRVEAESVIAGPGLERIYRFMRGRNPGMERADDPLRDDEVPAAVARAALERADPTAVESVALFFRCFGAFAGDLALTVDARGGVYICGGVTPKLLPLLRRGDFRRAFCAKGTHSALAARYPIKVILDPRLGLRGAAHLAAVTCPDVYAG